MFREHLKMIIAGKQMDEEQMSEMITEVLSVEITDAQIGAMMGALATRGETYEKLAGAATAMRRKAHRIQPQIGFNLGPVSGGLFIKWRNG